MMQFVSSLNFLAQLFFLPSTHAYQKVIIRGLENFSLVFVANHFPVRLGFGFTRVVSHTVTVINDYIVHLFWFNVSPTMEGLSSPWFENPRYIYTGSTM